jgi:tryptophanyl-tRNA synthetase
LTFKGTHVPVGDDQTQHLELVNDIAQRFNTLFGDFFPQPKTLLSNPYSAKFPRIMNLRDGFTKMSKSSKSDSTRINLIDPPDLIRKKISKSKTDSIPEIFYDESRLEVSNLLRIFAEMKNISTEEASKGWKDIESFKSALSEILIQELSPIRQQTLETINSEELKNDLKKNAEKAREVAAKTLAEVNKLVGFS